MRVFVAGATGAIGTRLVPKLVERGHEVIGTSRSMDRAQRLHALGAEPVALDMLDRRAVRDAVLDAKPEAIIHQATALTGLSDFKHSLRCAKSKMTSARFACSRRYVTPDGNAMESLDSCLKPLGPKIWCSPRVLGRAHLGF